MIFIITPPPLAQKLSNGVASRDTITPCGMVKYHPSSNTLISTEQRGAVRNKVPDHGTVLSSVALSFQFVSLLFFLHTDIKKIRSHMFSNRGTLNSGSP